MKCEICGKKDPRLIVLLPIHRPDGKLNTLACEKCAKASKAYCQKHDTIHQGFIDGSTACLMCVEATVKAHENQAVRINDRLRAILDEREIEDLEEAAEMSAEITGSTEEIAILRFIASKAMRSGKTIEQIIEEVKQSESVRGLLWT